MLRKNRITTAPKEVLIFKNQYPYRVAKSIREASRLTIVPEVTIRQMIDSPLRKKQDRLNGGRTSPDGWGFDYLA